MKHKWLGRLIKTLIIVLVPLIAGLVVGNYAYKRYQKDYHWYYMEKASHDNAKERLLAYLKYTEERLEADKDGKVFFEEEIKNEDGEKLFTLMAVRAGSVAKDVSQYNKVGKFTGYKDEGRIKYYFALYDINYPHLAKTVDETGEHPYNPDELPSIKLKISDDAEKEKDIEITTIDTIAAEDGFYPQIFDYGEVTESGEENRFNMLKCFVLNKYDESKKEAGLDGFTENVSLTFKIISGYGSIDDKQTIELPAVEMKLTNNKIIKAENNIKLIEDFPQAYGKNIFSAGYTKFVFGRYIWWEVLTAVLLFGAAAIGFVAVWNMEDQKEKENEKKSK